MEFHHGQAQHFLVPSLAFFSNVSLSSVSENGVRKRWSIGYGLKICFLAEFLPFVNPFLGIRKRKRGKDKISGGSTATSDGMTVVSLFFSGFIILVRVFFFYRGLALLHLPFGRDNGLA